MAEQSFKKESILNFVILCPIFLGFSILLARWFDGHLQDFGVYWQAGHMILSGQNVYDTVQWETTRQIQGIVEYPARIFPYPLPLAVLFSILALVPLQSAYMLWMFFAQIAILVSVVLLVSFYRGRSGYFELLTIAGIFCFRPMFSIINSGQILAFLLLPLAASIWLFQYGKWFAGGFLMSVLTLKPSIGFPVLILAGIWLAFRKQWKGIWGMVAGGLVLVLIGALVNYRWLIDYLLVSENSFRRFFGMQPTLWGIIDKIFELDNVSIAIAFVCIAIVVIIEAYLFWAGRFKLGSLDAFATIVPAALLVTPYAWNYDQVILMIPIIYLLIKISEKHGIRWAALFMSAIVTLAFVLVAVAYLVEHDVWSFLNSLVIWVCALYFVVRDKQMYIQ